MKKFKINGKGLVGTINKKQMKKGSYSIAITAIVIAIVIAANLVMAEIPSQYTQVDVSEQKLYTISDETQKLLKSLDEDVTMYFIVQSDNKDGTVEKLLERYEDASSHIKVKQMELEDGSTPVNAVMANIPIKGSRNFRRSQQH